jgi:hypothetical protein
MDNYYKLKYLIYKIKYLKYQNLYGGKLVCTCTINKGPPDEKKEKCECEIHDDKTTTTESKKSKKGKKPIDRTKIEATIKKLQAELEKHQAMLKELEAAKID